jgi:hypothetical protein
LFERRLIAERHGVSKEGVFLDSMIRELRRTFDRPLIIRRHAFLLDCIIVEVKRTLLSRRQTAVEVGEVEI